MIAYADQISNFSDLVSRTKSGILNPLVYFFISLAVVFFLWGVFKYIKSGDSEDEREKAKDFIVYGIIGIFVAISVWGFVNILKSTFDLETDVPEPVQYYPQ